MRRLMTPNFINHYFVGDGLDIGGKPDPLGLYGEQFTHMGTVRTWDLEDGDGQLLVNVEDETYDFVHSSHCLEHLLDPAEGLKNWLRVIKPGGHIVVTVPDEDLYEQGIFPSTNNKDHKWTFTIYKEESWCEKSINLLDLVRQLGANAELVRLEQLSSTYRFGLPRYDQTLSPIAECGIEFIIRKRTAGEVSDRGRWKRPKQQPDRETRLHLNQYKDDMASLKSANGGKPPFENDSDI